jgi:hypothetical protein
MCLQFGFVIFWRKDFGAKAANKLWVKLPPSGNIWRRNSTSFYESKVHMAKAENPN